MDQDRGSYMARLSEFYSEHRVESALLGLSILLIILSIAVLVQLQLTSPKITFESEHSQNETGTIEVHVAGAVVKPGLYNLSSESRLQDALNAAGGLSADADRTYFDKNLNLAAKINDSDKIYIVAKGEVDEASVLGQNTSTTISGLTNINTASAKELEGLSGIGPVTAEKIINGRPYNSVNELTTNKIINNGQWEKIKDQISTN